MGLKQDGSSKMDGAEAGWMGLKQDGSGQMMGWSRMGLKQDGWG